MNSFGIALRAIAVKIVGMDEERRERESRVQNEIEGYGETGPVDGDSVDIGPPRVLSRSSTILDVVTTCRACHASVPDGSRFCGACGRPVASRRPSTQADTAETTKSGSINLPDGSGARFAAGVILAYRYCLRGCASAKVRWEKSIALTISSSGRP